MENFRPASVPLMVFDPYFSIWSFNDKLYEDVTRHWTGSRNAMVGMVRCGDEVWRFMGKLADREYYYKEPDVIEQKSVTVRPTVTEYIFENEKLLLKVRFINPVTLDDLELLSRPVGYIEYEATPKNGDDIEVYFDISADACVNNYTSRVKLNKTEFGISCGNAVQNILGKSGDAVRIDWGYLHLLEKDGYFCNGMFGRNDFVLGRKQNALTTDKIYSVHKDNPVMAVVKKGNYGKITVAYDDIKCIEYFGKQIDSYYKINGDTFTDMCKKALSDFDKVKKKCDDFDKKLTKKAEAVSSEYADIMALAYRQAIGAHKLCFDEKGLLFISKECFSNGCSATVDVTYPSMPLFILYNPELVKGMLRPIFEYANSKMWRFEFAPHDVGIYPMVNKQMYGYEKRSIEWILSRQMPVEECGNMILCTYAVCNALKDKAYAEENRDLLIKWAEYLIKNGKDPENQLCTDDFNGNLDRNCNLSVKAILSIYACGKMLDVPKYMDIAKDYAIWWKENAKENDHYKLSFGADNTWSIKYNMVWDKIFGFNLFSDVYETETDYYVKNIGKYGVPLDSRGKVGKNDWIMWASMLCKDEGKRNEIIKSVWNMINETRNRVPIADYYNVVTGEQKCWAEYYTWNGFQNRSVVGGFAILMI